MDGWITIGTELSTDKFDKQITDLNNKIAKEERKKVILEAKFSVQEQELDKAIKKVEELNEAYKKFQELDKVIGTGRATYPQVLEYRSLREQYGSLENLSNMISKAASQQQNLEMKVENTVLSYDNLVDRVNNYKMKIDNINLQKHSKEVNNMKKTFQEVNKEAGSFITKTAKSVGKLALSVFAIRSAYMTLRRASSELASYDPQYAANLEYIRFVLTQAIAPVLKWIVSLAGTLLGYVYAILNAWFGIGAKLNLGVDAFKKMKTNAGGVGKAVKEIKKDLLGFDEITRLTDQSSTGTSAGAGGVAIPDFDLGNLGGEIPKWLQWIIDHKKEVLAILGTIAALVAAIKISSFLSKFKTLMTLFRQMGALKVFGLFTGLVVAIKGIIDLIPALINFFKNPTWDNFTKVLKGLEEVLIGVGIAMIALNASNPLGWIVLVTGAVVGLVRVLTENEKQILNTKDAQEKLTKAMQETKKATDDYVNAVDNAEEAERKLKEAEDKHKISGQELYEAVQNGTLDYKDMNDAQREVYKAYLDNINAQDDLKQSSQELYKAKYEEKKASLENAAAIANETGNYEDLKNKIIDMYNNEELSVIQLRDLMERAMANMDEDTRQTFLEGLPDSIKSGLNPDKYNGAWNNFKRKWNEFVNSLTMTKTLSIGIGLGGGFSAGGGYGGGSGGGGARAKGGIFYPSQLPKLALGGIINVPGRGMAYNGAIIGERGAEAVVPLTDTQQMELLGATIGKYITVNANIINTMNGRVISRELKQVKSEEDFAYNT